jgi:hypothetical protein
MSDVVVVKMLRENAEALVDTHPEGWKTPEAREQGQRRQEGARAEITEALERPTEDESMTTEETKAKLAERLKAITVSLQLESGSSPADMNATAKFIFDLRAAAEGVEDLEQLLALIEANPEDERIVELAQAAGERLSKANPEPRIV